MLLSAVVWYGGAVSLPDWVLMRDELNNDMP